MTDITGSYVNARVVKLDGLVTQRVRIRKYWRLGDPISYSECWFYEQKVVTKNNYQWTNFAKFASTSPVLVVSSLLTSRVRSPKLSHTSS